MCIRDSPGGDRGGHHLHDDREGSGPLQREGVLDQCVRRVSTSLNAITAEDVLALGGETDVSHDRDTGPYQKLDLGDHGTSTFELDRVRQALLHEPVSYTHLRAHE